MTDPLRIDCYFSLEIVARAQMPSERSRADARARRREREAEGVCRACGEERGPLGESLTCELYGEPSEYIDAPPRPPDE